MNDEERENKRRSFDEFVKSVGDFPACKFCGRCMMIGICCKAAKDESIALYKANTPLKTRIKNQFYRILYMFHPINW